MAPLGIFINGETIDATFKGKNVQYCDNAYFKRKNVQDWEINAQSSILNAETLDVKPLKKFKDANLKKYILLA